MLPIVAINIPEQVKLVDKSLLTEKEKAALNYIENKTKNISHSGETLIDHFYGTYSILKNLKQTEDVCIAGLYHSIYGTDYFKPGVDVDEQEIENIIGKYSNDLVKVFCSKNRDEVILKNTVNVDTKTHLDLLYLLYANFLEQAFREVNQALTRNRMDIVNRAKTRHANIVSKIELIESSKT